MSKELPENNKQSEEVDLGQLFNLIANGFQKLFNFIASIFKGIYHVFLIFLIHLSKRLKWYGLAMILGVGVGYYLDKTSEEHYAANLYIETNFGSTHQVYENLRYLHQLAAKDHDSIELARKLKLTVKEATTLKGFYIKPDIDETDKVKMFSEYRMQLDSTSRADLIFEDYIDNLDFFSFKRHQIGVAATDKFIYQKIKDNFVEAIGTNEYLTKLKKVRRENLESQKKTTRSQIKEIDSLAIEYLKIRKRESEKEPMPGTGTNLYMGNAQQSKLLVDESELLFQKVQLDSIIRSVNSDLVRDENVINVIADFPDAGYDISEWTDKKKFVLPIGFFLVVFFGFIALGLKKYLKEQDLIINKKK